MQKLTQSAGKSSYFKYLHHIGEMVGSSLASRWYKRLALLFTLTIGISFSVLLSRNVELHRQDLLRSSFRDRASAMITNFDLAIANNSIRLNSFENSLWQKNGNTPQINVAYVKEILHNSSFTAFNLVKMQGFDADGVPILVRLQRIAIDKKIPIPSPKPHKYVISTEVRRAAQTLRSTHGVQIPFLTYVDDMPLLDTCMRSVDYPGYFFVFAGRAELAIPNLDLLNNGDYLFVRQSLDGSNWAFTVDDKGAPLIRPASTQILTTSFDYSYHEEIEEENLIGGVVPFQRSVKSKSHDISGNWIPQIILLVGFVVTIMACAFLRSILNRKEEVENLVIEKTKALSIETEKANASARAKSQFLANVSHEIRTPLNMILGMADVAAELASSDQQKDYLYNLKNSGKHLLVLIDDILEMSRIEAHDIRFAKADVELIPLLENVIELTWPNISKKNLRFIIDLDLSLPMLIHTDASRIKQIILNLLNNATKYTKEGYVSISVKRAQDQEKKPGTEWLEFRVRDSGVGIPKDKQKNIFLPFYQVGKAHFRDSGVGLGLAIINGIVTKFDGTILLNSDVGNGSDFKVILPVEIADDRQWSENLGEIDRNLTHVYMDIQNPEVKRQFERYLQQLNISVVDYDSNAKAMDRKNSILILDDGPKSKNFRDLLSNFERVVVLSPKPVTHAADYPNVKYLSEPLLPSKLVHAFGWDMSHKKHQEPILELSREGVAAVQSIKSNANLSLIIADDDPTNQILMSAYLRDTNWKIRFANDGQEAYDQCLQDPPDVIVADLQMPNVDGFKLLSMLRDSTDKLQGRFPKFIILTADAIAEVESEARKLKVDTFLTKPIDKTRFFHAIWQVTGAQQAQPVANTNTGA